MKKDIYDSIIIGGGFYGLYIADFIASQGKRVLLCEYEDSCMTHASYNNQARIHSGYHYPRSLLTGMRSCLSFPRFIKEFPDCVIDDFAKYYAIGRILGKVTAQQFQNFCQHIGAPCQPAPSNICRLFNSHYIEAVFDAREFAFDATILRDNILQRCASNGVEICTGTQVLEFRQIAGGGLETDITSKKEGGLFTIRCRNLYNCTYARINKLNAASGIRLIPLKHEMTEMALVEVPEEIQNRGFTVMCGPFFSIMPFPSRQLYTLSHVRYTPHYEWYDKEENDTYTDAYRILAEDPKHSYYQAMVHDAARYMPSIGKTVYRDSLWEVKTVLPISEVDDSRPILFKSNYAGISGYHCIMGGKIDNIYDCMDFIRQIERNGPSSS